MILEPTPQIFHFSPIYLPWNDGLDAMIFVFWKLSFKPTFSRSSFTFIKRFFSFSLLYTITMVSSAYQVVGLSHSDLDSSLWVIQFGILPDVLCIEVKQARWQYTALTYSFPILNHSVVPCLVLTIASGPAYKFLRRQVRWCGIPISWRIFHSLL